MSRATRQTRTRLALVYPNPFQRDTTIRFDAAERQSIGVTIYDTAGRSVRTLQASEVVDPGTYELTLEP